MGTRRRFLRNAALAAAALAAGSARTPLAWAARAAPAATRPPGVFVDLHYHASLRATVRESPAAVAVPLINPLAQATFNRTGGSWKECHRAGIDMICAVHYNPFDEAISMAADPSLDAERHTLRMLDLFETELNGPASAHARLALTPASLKRALEAHAQGTDDRVIALHALEGGHALGGSLEALDTYARRGVAFITLTHFFDKGLASVGNALPFFPDAGNDWPHRGLSGFGRDVIARMEELGMLVDVTHASSTALEDIFKVAKRPFFASHASARALGDHPYSMPDEHLQEIARRGGIVGVVLFPQMLGNYGTLEMAQDRGSLADVVRTVRYLVKVLGGHRHIGIGSDFSGFIVGPKDMSRLEEVGRLHAALMAEFSDEGMVRDILARNAIRYFTESWGRA